MEQDIAMLNAHMISNLSVDRPIARNGKVTEVTMEAAVPSLMFGRRINMQMLTQFILVQFQDIIAARANNVAMEPKDKMVIVIKMVVILILTEMEIITSMDLDLASQLILLALLK